MPWHYTPDLSQSYVSEFPTNFHHTFLATQTTTQRAHLLQSSTRENSAALMGADQTVSSLQACLYLNWPSAGLQGVPSRISVGWISDPFCPYQETGGMSLGSRCKWRNSRPDSQMVSELSEIQHPWKRTDVHYFYTLTMGTDSWASDTHTAFPAVYTASCTRGTQTAWGVAIPTVNKETLLQKGTCVHATIHIKHKMLYHNTFNQNFTLKYKGMQWKSCWNKSATSRFIFAHREYHGLGNMPHS